MDYHYADSFLIDLSGYSSEEGDDELLMPLWKPKKARLEVTPMEVEVEDDIQHLDDFMMDLSFLDETPDSEILTVEED